MLNGTIVGYQLHRQGLPFVLVSMLAILIAQNFVLHNNFLWPVLIAALIGTFLLRRYQLALILVMMSVFLLDWLSDAVALIPPQVTWLPELLIIFLLLVILLNPRKNSFCGSSVDLPLLFLAVMGLASFVASDSELAVGLAGFRNYFKFILFFYVVLSLDLSDNFLRNVVKFIIAAAFLQAPVAIIQRLVYINIASGDVVGGTLGKNSSGTLTLFLLAVISIMVGFFFNKRLRTRQLILSMLILFIPMGLNETKVTFYLFPLLILFFLGRFLRKFQLRRILGLAFFATILFFAVLHSYQYFYTDMYSKDVRLFDSSYVVPYISQDYRKGGSLNRIAQVRFAHDNIKKDLSTALLGVGPGNASDSFFEGAVGHYFRKYETLKIDSVFLARFLWEFGYLGLIVFLYILWKLWLLAREVNRGCSDTFHKSIAIGFEGILVVLLVASIYSSSFIADSLGYLFWFLAAYLVRISRDMTLRPERGTLL